MKVCVIFAYNRFDLFAKTLEAASSFAFDKIYIAIDGANDELAVEEQIMMHSYIDCRYDDRLITLRQSENQGCKRQFLTVLTKIFSQHDFAVILEDDCIPDIEFFDFCFQMKSKFEMVDEVGIISGSNLLSFSDGDGEGYFLSNTPNFWGWATWSKYWNLLDPYASISEIDKKYRRSVVSQHLTKSENLYWREIFKNSFMSEKIWDFLFTFALFCGNIKTVYPIKSLIVNKGFDHRSTHTKSYMQFTSFEDAKGTMRHYSDFSLHNRLALRHIYRYSYFRLLKLKLGNILRLAFW